jgi:RNA polymerase-binding transcription factor DksA
MLWMILAVALVLVGTASFGPAGGIRKRVLGGRGRRRAPSGAITGFAEGDRMTKDRAEQQRTDATRIGEAGSGKLDQPEVPATGEPVPREAADGTSASGQPHDAAFLTDARQRVERERQAAIDRFRELGVSPEIDETAPRAGTAAVLDEGDEAQASERRDMTFMTRQRLAERINRLSAALERIAQGQYGRCAVCGGAIEPARLAALPETDTCVVCQERRERGAAPQAAA